MIKSNKENVHIHNAALLGHKHGWILSFVGKYMDLETTMLSESNHTQKVKHYMVSLIWESKNINKWQNKVDIIGNKNVGFLEIGKREKERRREWW